MTDLFARKRHSYPALRARCDAVAKMVHERAQRAYSLALGGDGRPKGLDWCVIHNSLVSLEYGQPWREVDYSHMRRARWLLEERQHKAHDALRRLYERIGHQWFEWQ
jgi:hypothetical protein